MLLSLILRSVWSRPARSLLTGVGIGVSVGLIVATFALAAAIRSELAVSAEFTEADLVATQRGLAGPLGGSIPESSVQTLESYDGVQRTTGFLITSLRLGGIPAFNLFGVCPEDTDLYLSDAHIIEGVCVQGDGEIGLGQIAADALNTGIGETVEFDSGRQLAVTGIYQTGNIYLDSGGMVSLYEAQVLTGREGKVTLVAMYLDEGTDQGVLVNRIESEMRYLTIVDAPSLLQTSSTIKTADVLAWILSLLAIVMASIGVLNTMSMSVAEQTKDIGILKAIGWSRFKVLTLILGQAILISILGFAIGSCLGVGVFKAVAELPGVSLYMGDSLRGYSFVVGLGMALLLGVAGGALPAYRAFRLSPVEAFRHD